MEFQVFKVVLWLQTLNFTDACAQKVWDLIEEEEDNQGLNLRVYIQGGCSGFQYGFMFDTEVRDDDCVVPGIVNAQGEVLGTVRLLVDSLSYPYLKGLISITERTLQANSSFETLTQKRRAAVARRFRLRL